jgi:hypothetical protein
MIVMQMVIFTSWSFIYLFIYLFILIRHLINLHKMTCIPYNTIQYNTIQYNTKTIQYKKTKRYNLTQDSTVYIYIVQYSTIHTVRWLEHHNS